MTDKPRYRLQADGKIIAVDSLTNVVANLGTSRDKASASLITAVTMSPQTLMQTYRGSWAARKGVDIPALDSCRKWRDWQANKDEITAIEVEEKRLGVKVKTLAARIASRLFGGCALFIGDGGANPALPLNPETIKQGGVKYLAMVHRRMMSPGQLEENPASEQFGKPSMWTINSGGAMAVTVHPSRLVMFQGAALPDDAIAGTEQGWGDSVLVSAISAILNYDATVANIASLVFEAKVDTIGIPDFMSKLGDSGYEQVILKRFALAEAGKGINGTLIHDADETLGQKQASFASLPDLMDRFSQLTCAAFDVPATRFMGQSPAGMSATGESDLRNYYDRISAAQELEMAPAMAVLDECLIRSALGSRPPEVHYRWASLWQSTDKERADIGKVQADTIAALKTTGLFPDEPLAEAAVNALTESGAFPGLEGDMNDFYEANPDWNEEDLGAMTPPVDPLSINPTQPVIAADAAPRTLYVRRDVMNVSEIVAWAKSQGFTEIVPDLHVTIAYSTTPVDWFAVGTSYSDKLEIPAGGPRQMDCLGPDGRYIALLITATELVWRNREIRDAGASWNWPEYQPHISIQVGGEIDLTTVKPYLGKVVLGPEIFEEIRQ